MTIKAAKKEHKEHQAAIRPLLKHLKSDENKIRREKPMRHHLTHKEEKEGGEHSHAHHKKMHDHHMGEAKKHASHLHKMAKKHGSEHHQKAHKTTAHDRAVDRKNLMKARKAR